VLATALLNQQLFVTRANDAKVYVYNTTSFQLIRNIMFTGLSSCLYGLATSAINNYLYISDGPSNCVHRVDLSVTSPVSVVTWSVPVQPWQLLGVSMTSAGNILMVLWTTPNKISEYTSNGSLVRVITNSNALWHAIEVNKDIWAFTVKGPKHGICTTLTNGTLIKCYGSAAGSAITQMNDPRCLAVASGGYILVGDLGNNRILVVDPSLSEARQLPLPLNTGLNSPLALTFDQSRGRLYVGEDSGQYRLLVFDGFWRK